MANSHTKLSDLKTGTRTSRGVYSVTILKRFPQPLLISFPKFYNRKEEKTSLNENSLKKCLPAGWGGLATEYTPLRTSASPNIEKNFSLAHVPDLGCAPVFICLIYTLYIT